MTSRDQLIEAGLWPGADSRDPLTDEGAANVLMRRLTDRFGPVTIAHNGNTGEFAVNLLEMPASNPVAVEETREQAICAAALKLARLNPGSNQGPAASGAEAGREAAGLLPVQSKAAKDESNNE